MNDSQKERAMNEVHRLRGVLKVWMKERDTYKRLEDVCRAIAGSKTTYYPFKEYAEVKILTDLCGELKQILEELKK